VNDLSTPATSDGDHPDELLTFPQVFRQELEVVLPGTDWRSTSDDDVEQVIADERLAALCLSGGGIRSATFALGVLQALARFSLLGEFHYLSTVSGGGYIGSWLSTWRSVDTDENVFDGLNANQNRGAEPDEIKGIRADSNYITPRLGLFSLDTWTVLALYLRNLLLNWLIFAPLFVGSALLPTFWRSVLLWAGHHADYYAHYVWLLIGCVLLCIGLGFAIYGRFKMKEPWLNRRCFLVLVLIPIVASALSFSVAAYTRTYFPRTRWDLLVGFVCGLVAYALAWVAARKVARPSTEKVDGLELVAWVLSGAAVGTMMALVLRLMEEHRGLMEADPAKVTQVIDAAEKAAAIPSVVLGLSGAVGAYLIGDILYVGISSLGPRGEMDREWLARASGWLAAVAVVWAIFGALTLYGPHLLSELPVAVSSIVGMLGGASGIVTLALGSSAKTAATPAGDAQQARAAVAGAGKLLWGLRLDQIVSIAAVIFASLLVISVATLGQWAVRETKPNLTAWLGYVPFPVYELGVMVALLLAASLISVFVNVNRFSLHALYRNRIARTFIGSARGRVRSPDPFTHFDNDDNVSIALVKPKTKPDRLFHVVNVALNVVATKNRAWQERKAESFTFTRLHCGNPLVGFRLSRYYAKSKVSNGVSLATATAISGAAVSPNQGYNSSPLVGLLLMLFNVRLGWWFGNPSKQTYGREGPTLGIASAIRELAGATTDEGRWIYLSDGGHFENLGLYEMIRRRCRCIVVSDAGCDPDFTFEDLGNAARKVFIDLGVSINFRKLELQPRQNPPRPGVRFAIGEISYPRSTKPGWLLYIKPTYQAAESVDVRSYASMHARFPHESTADQWFGESQLESYRALGAYIVENICTLGKGVPPGTTPASMSLMDLRSIAEQYLGPGKDVEHEAPGTPSLGSSTANR